jgi:ABC-type amino acid transport substrate-binding protein
MKNNHLKRLLGILVMGVIVFLATISLQACGSRLSVAIVESYNPLVQIDEESGKFAGVELDVIRAVADKLGKPVSFEKNYRIDFDRLQKGMTKCSVDFTIMGDKATPGDQPGYGIFSDGYLPSGPVLVARYDETRFNNAQEAAAYSVDESVKDRPLAYESTLLSLYQEDYDAVWVNDYFTVLKAIQKYPNRFKIIDGLPSDRQHVLWVCNNDEFAAEVNQALAELRTEGVIDQILNKWVGADQAVAYAPPPTPAPVAAWGNIVPKTVCLQERYYNHSVEDFMEFDNLTALLKKMGIEVVAEGEICDFSLSANYEMDAICSVYLGDGKSTKCCTGATVEGMFTIRSGEDTREFPFENKIEPSPSVTGLCSGDPTQAPFITTGFFTEMIKALGDVLGARVYYFAMHQQGSNYPEYYAAHDYFLNIDEVEAVTILISYLESDIPAVRENAYLFLLDLGSRYDKEMRYGSDMHQDPAQWRIWWQQQWGE